MFIEVKVKGNKESYILKKKIKKICAKWDIILAHARNIKSESTLKEIYLFQEESLSNFAKIKID